MRRLRTLFSTEKTRNNPVYFRYIGWSFASNICVSIQSAMSTHEMLRALSVNSDMQSLNYIGKDIIGQLGTLGYITKISKEIDSAPKKFIIKNNTIQQISIFLMMNTPYLGSFLITAGLSNLLVNITFIGIGAINARCIKNLSSGDIGEIYAKVAIINTIGSSIGLMIGVCINCADLTFGARLIILGAIGAMRIYTFRKAVNEVI